MAAAYTVLFVIAVMGVGLGWRLTPPRSDSAHAVGLPRLLQLGIAGTAVIVCMILLIPWVEGLDQSICSAKDFASGNCVAGLREQALFGSAIFACLVGVGLAFVVRKGVIDYPLVLEPPEPIETRPGDRRDLATPVEPSKPASNTEPPSPPKPPEPAREPAEPPPEAPPARDPSGLSPWRRLSGPAFVAFVDERVAIPDEAIQVAARRLRSNQIAIVFSRGASREANLALLELAEVLQAHRYVLESTDGAADGPGDDVDQIAGPEARHAGELALDLAGSLIETVMLIDTRVEFPTFVLGKLTELQSVCIAHAHDAVSDACQVLLPGTNPGEHEGELVANAGETNNRHPREWWVRRILQVLRDDVAAPSVDSTDPQRRDPDVPESP